MSPEFNAPYQPPLSDRPQARHPEQVDQPQRPWGVAPDASTQHDSINSGDPRDMTYDRGPNPDELSKGHSDDDLAMIGATMPNDAESELRRAPDVPDDHPDNAEKQVLEPREEGGQEVLLVLPTPADVARGEARRAAYLALKAAQATPDGEPSGDEPQAEVPTSASTEQSGPGDAASTPAEARDNEIQPAGPENVTPDDRAASNAVDVRDVGSAPSNDQEDNPNQPGAPATEHERRWRPGELPPALSKTLQILAENGITVYDIPGNRRPGGNPLSKAGKIVNLLADPTNELSYAEIGASLNPPETETYVTQVASRLQSALAKTAPEDIKDQLPKPTGALKGKERPDRPDDYAGQDVNGLRKASDLSLTDLSNETGVSVSALSRFFNAETLLSPEKLEKVLETLGANTGQTEAIWDKYQKQAVERNKNMARDIPARIQADTIRDESSVGHRLNLIRVGKNIPVVRMARDIGVTPSKVSRILLGEVHPKEVGSFEAMITYLDLPQQAADILRAEYAVERAWIQARAYNLRQETMRRNRTET